jgi:hypothetical protein
MKKLWFYTYIYLFAALILMAAVALSRNLKQLSNNINLISETGFLTGFSKKNACYNIDTSFYKHLNNSLVLSDKVPSPIDSTYAVKISMEQKCECLFNLAQIIDINTVFTDVSTFNDFLHIEALAYINKENIQIEIIYDLKNKSLSKFSNIELLIGYIDKKLSK